MRVAWCSMTVASMSMIEPAVAALRERLGRLRRDAPARADRPHGETTIVPRDTIAGSALTAVVAIMTFLAAATSGGVAMVIRSASEYQSDIAREMTIQVRPTPGNDIDAEVLKAESIARAAPGMGDVRTYSKAESERLLEPWLGGLSLDELPVPRMIAVRVAPGAHVDTADAAPGARREGRRCDARRPPHLDRTDAQDGGGRGRRRPRHLRPGAGGDRALGRLRHPRRDVEQPPDRRGAAFRRRQGGLHRLPVPASFPRPRPQGRDHRRARGDGVPGRSPDRSPTSSSAPRGKPRRPRCSARSRSEPWATPWWRARSF